MLFFYGYVGIILIVIGKNSFTDNFADSSIEVRLRLRSLILRTMLPFHLKWKFCIMCVWLHLALERMIRDLLQTTASTCLTERFVTRRIVV